MRTCHSGHRGMSSFLCHFSFSRGRKSFVEIDAGDKGTVPNGWIHKMVRFSGGTARFGGSHLIHWDTTLRHSNFIRGLRLIAGQHPTWKIWKWGVRCARRHVCVCNIWIDVKPFLFLFSPLLHCRGIRDVWPGLIQRSSSHSSGYDWGTPRVNSTYLFLISWTVDFSFC